MDAKTIWYGGREAKGKLQGNQYRTKKRSWGTGRAVKTEQKIKAGARGQITGQPGQRNKNEAAARGGKATNSFKAVEAQLAADPPPKLVEFPLMSK